MEYSIPIGAGRVLIPLSLIMRSGERVGALVPGADSASALVAVESGTGEWNQEFHPLRIATVAVPEIGSSEWVLRGLRSGSQGWSYFLDLPETKSREISPRSLAIQIVGHASFHPDSFFEGQVSLALGKTATPSWSARFSRLRDQWLPELLPEKFSASASLHALPGDPDRRLLIVPLIRLDGADLPPSLRSGWEATGWTDAVAERTEGQPPAHFLIRGGCFWSAEDGASHWFGGKIGLDKPGFRSQSAQQIRSVAAHVESGWCFWVESPTPAGFGAVTGKFPLRIRHPAQSLAWKDPVEMLRNGGTATSPEYRSAMEMLRDAAGLQAQGLSESEADVESFYRKHTPILRRLAAFLPGLGADRAPNPLADITAFAAAVYKTLETK